MKRRLFAIAMTLAMALSLLPVTALAEKANPATGTLSSVTETDEPGQPDPGTETLTDEETSDEESNQVPETAPPTEETTPTVGTDGWIEVDSATDLSDALKTGGNIRLAQSFEVSTAQNWEIADNVTVVLDLNNCTITSTYAGINNFILEINGGSLTITDNSDEKGGAIKATDASYGYGIQLRGENSSFTLLDGTIETTQETVDIYTTAQNCSVTISGGKLVSTEDSVLGVRGKNTTVNISDGEMESAGRTAVYISNYGEPDSIQFTMTGGSLTHTDGRSGAMQIYKGATVTITGDAKIDAQYTGLQAQENVVLNVTGGTIEAGSSAVSAEGQAQVNISGGEISSSSNSTTSGTVEAEGSAQVTITSGTLTSERNSVYAEDDATVTISGGDFKNNTTNTANISKDETSDAKITVIGGTFDQKVPEEYLPSGMTQDEDGTVKTDTEKAVAIVDGAAYDDLQEAIAALKDNSTMQILSDVDVTATREEDTFGSCFIIDEDNVTITAYDSTKKPTIYGFSNKFNDGEEQGLNGQSTIYVTGKNVTLKDLILMPLGGFNNGSDRAPDYLKTVGVTSTATDFQMINCETVPNTQKKGDQAPDTMTGSAGLIHISNDSSKLTGNSFGTGTTVAAGWKGATAQEGTYSVDASGNYWGENVTVKQIAGMIEGNIVIDNYYTDEDMTASVELGGILVSDAEELQAAVRSAQGGDTILVLPGEYDITPDNSYIVEGQTGWYLPITTDNLTIQGINEDGSLVTDAQATKATIYSDTETTNGAWATQNLITVFGDNVTLAGLKIMPKEAVNKTIEVAPDAQNFTIRNCAIVPSDVEGAPDDAGSLYFNGDKGTVIVEDNYFYKMTLSFDSVGEATSILVEGNVFDTPKTDTTQMISNVTWTSPKTLEMADVTIRDNTFKNLPEDYDKVVLNRMDGAFILEENEAIMVDSSTGDLTEMVSFDDNFFDGWAAFAESGSKIVITKDGVTTVLTPPTSEEADPVAKSVTVTPATASAYTGDSVAISATLTGFESSTEITWAVTPDTSVSYTVSGNRLTFKASQAGTYTVTATADNVSASAVVTVTAQPDRPSSGGGSSVTRYTVSVPDDIEGGSVRVSPTRASRGQTVTITVDPDEGYELDRLVVWDADGERIDLERKSDTKYTFEMPRGKVTVEATFAEIEDEDAIPFRDVDTDDWFYDAVVYAYDTGLMSGVSDDQFAPGATLTRAMVAQMLYSLEGRPRTGSAGYADVAFGAWYEDAVAWISSEGLMTGYSDAAFGPNDPLTREQLALILYNYADWAGYDVRGGVSLGSYIDADSASTWAVEALEWAIDAGLISGRGDGILAPAGTATRAEVAQIFMNFLENVAQ